MSDGGQKWLAVCFQPLWMKGLSWLPLSPCRPYVQVDERRGQNQKQQTQELLQAKSLLVIYQLQRCGRHHESHLKQ